MEEWIAAGRALCKEHPEYRLLVELVELGSELHELNPDNLRRMLVQFRRLVSAERTVASPEVCVLLDLLTAKISGGSATS